MNHTGLENKVTFTQEDVEISKVSTRKVVVVGVVDHESRMYKFSHFLPYSLGNALLSHANEVRRIWNESFGHINYIYIQYLTKEKMVEGLLGIKFSKGTCKGCIVGKHAERKFGKGKERRVVQVLKLIH